MPPRMWQFTHCPNDLSPASISATMSRLRVLNVYSADGVLNQRTRQVPVNGLTLSVHTLREMVGEVQEMLIMDSVTVRNVPGAPVVVAGSTAAFTLSLLLFEHLQSDASEIVVAGEDAVGIELNFVHAFIIGATGAKSIRGRTDVDPSQRRSIRQHRPEPI